MSVGFPASVKLNQWAFSVKQVFGGDVYLVGSALTKKNTRDVDVVCLLDDEEFERIFGEAPFGEWNWRWAGLCLAFSEWGKSATGLNIDFKFQPNLWANENHKGGRGALGNMVGSPAYQNTYKSLLKKSHGSGTRGTREGG